MFPIVRIVVPTDFSEFAQQAVAKAGALAKTYDAELVVVHCLQPIAQVASIPVAGLTLPNLDDQLRAAADTHLQEVHDAVAGEGVKVRTELREGRPADEVVAVAEETKADLIVVSTHGRTGLSRVLVGSVAEQIIRHAPCPVLVWRPRAGAK